MRRGALAVGAVAILIGVAWAARQLERVPDGQARIDRRGDAFDVTSAGWSWGHAKGPSCLAPQSPSGAGLRFSERLSVPSTTAEPHRVALELTYRVPASVDRAWPDGTWCEALAAAVRDEVVAWVRGLDPETAGTVDDPAVVAALSARLESRGLDLLRFEAGYEPPTSWSEPILAPEIVERSTAGRRVFVIGLDGADWSALDPLMASGRMPNLARLVAEGSDGVLESEHPPLSPLLWTTMVTGVSPLEHRILDFTRFRPDDGSKEPITSTERAVPAIWNMASAGGRSVVSLGLWATYPAERVDGLLVSDRLFTFLFTEDDPPPGIVYPPSREPWARDLLRAAEEAVDLEMLQRFLPDVTAEELDRRRRAENPYEHPVSALTRILVETTVYDEMFRSAVREVEPDFAFLYLQGTDSIGHVFAAFAPPRLPQVGREEYDRYHEVPGRYFEWIDELLGAYTALAEEEGAVLALVSDHGFRWREGRPELSSFDRATAARWHRREGIYLLWGPGIPGRSGHDADQGGLRRVTATLLALLGLPRAEGVAGPPLVEVAGAPAEADYAALYRPAPELARPSSGASAAAELAELRALGYLGAGEGDRAPTPGSTRTAGSFNNEGLILRQEGDEDRAIAAFESALALAPQLASAAWNLSDLLYSRGEEERSNDLLLTAFANGLPMGRQFLVGRAIGLQRAGRLDEAVDLVDRGVEARPEDAELWLFLGRYRVEGGACGPAAEAFDRAIGLAPDNPAAYSSAAMARLCLGDREAALALVEQSLTIEPDQPQLRALVARLTGAGG